MKYLICFILGMATVLFVNATFETDIPCHYMQVEKPVVLMENQNTDGMTKRVAVEIYVDRIFRGIISNEVIYATNEIDTGVATIKTVPVDDRLAH